jgi:hypothetical protein
MISSNVDPFPAAALETNRGGRLSDAQRGRLKGLARAGRKDEFLLAVICAVAAVVLLAAVRPASNPWLGPLAGVALILVALVLFRVAINGDALTKDMRTGQVQVVEGAIGKRTYDTQGQDRRLTHYYLEVAGQSFNVDETAYLAAPDAGYVRLYVLPRSHVIVNLERMPDRPLPAGALNSPAEAIRTAITAVLSGDPVQSAEARAEMETMKNAMATERATVAIPPPADRRDPRPLAEAILGTWQTGPFSITFLPDGTTVIELPGGRKQQGRWTIGSDGRLHDNTNGRDRANDAWVAGDVLTIAENGQGMAYHRAPAS